MKRDQLGRDCCSHLMIDVYRYTRFSFYLHHFKSKNRNFPCSICRSNEGRLESQKGSLNCSRLSQSSWEELQKKTAWYSGVAVGEWSALAAMAIASLARARGR